MKLRIRIDKLDETTEAKLTDFVTKSKSHCLVYHYVNDNPHYHFYLDDDRFMSCQSLRYHIDKIVGVTKGHQRSVKECQADRIDEYLQYLFNEKHGNKWRLVSSNIDVEQHQAKAAAVAEDFTKTVLSKGSKRKEVTTWDISEEVKNLYLADGNKPESEYDIYKLHIDYAIDVCRKYHKTYTDFSIQRIVQTAITANRCNRDQFTRNILDKIFRRN